ncbi:MAG: response regulator [Calditrichaeota bacterium]|nr:response regulator [Calditrichota bacterium]
MKTLQNIGLWGIALLVSTVGLAFFALNAQAIASRHPFLPGIPPLHNYPPEAYNEHSQNWEILRDLRGVLYAGNGHGILEFDGASWRLIKTGPESRVRSLAMDSNGTIYVGGSTTFGYLAPDSLGQMVYISLLDQLPEEERELGEVWKAHCTSHGVYFQTFDRLFRWSDGRMKIWKADPLFFLSYLVEDTLYISQRFTGIFKVAGDSLQLLPGSKDITRAPVYSILSGDGKGLLVCVGRRGLFHYRHGIFTPFPTEADTFLLTHHLSSAVALPGGRTGLGTFGGGIAIIDEQGRLDLRLDKSTGLQNNDVKHLFWDYRGHLWLSLDQGITQVRWPPRFTYFSDKQGLPGKISAVLPHRERLYAATTQGIFYLDRGARGNGIPAFTQLTGTGMSYAGYALLSIDNLLLAGTNVGLFAIGESEPALISPSETVFALHQSRQDPHLLLVGHLSGLGMARLKDGNWQYEGKVDGISEEIRCIAEDSSGAFWLGTMHKGIVKVRFSENAAGVPEAQITRLGRDLLLNEGQVLFRNEDLLLSSARGLFSLDLNSNNVRPDSGFSPLLADSTLAVNKILPLNADSFLIDLYRGEEDFIWLMTRINPKNYQIDMNSLEDLQLQGGLNAVSQDEQGIYWVATQSGLVRWNSSIPEKTDFSAPPMLRRVSLINRPEQLFGGTQTSHFTAPVLPYRNNAVQFEFAVPELSYPEHHRFQYQLQGFDERWSDWTNQFRKDYTNLPEGNYTFRVRARNIFNHISPEARFHLRITAPWYRTWWMYLLYCLLIAGGLWAMVRIRVHQLQKKTRQLESLVEARTHTIRQQTEKLQELDQLKSRFFANISHEIRTPLTLILGPLENLLGRIGDDGIRDELQVMDRNGQRLLRLINQLLDLSRLESGRMPLKASRGNFGTFLPGLVMSFASLATQKEIRFESHFDPDVMQELNRTLYFDSDKLEKIITNLLTNAFKFTPAGGRVDVTCTLPEQKAAEEQFAEICIADSGPGISPDRLSYIFDRFYQVEGASPRQQAGSGIGLALAKELVEAHHGSISVASEPGKGSRFTVRLPLGTSAFQAEELGPSSHYEDTPIAPPPDFDTPALPAAEPPEMPDSTMDQPRILIVEDHDEVRHYIRNHLKGHFAIYEAEDGEKGVNLALEQIPDLIISDVMMPGLDGFQICEKLKGDHKTSHIPIILLTARAGEESKLTGLETGADDYLVKPFNPRELRTRVRNLIEQRRYLRERFRKEGWLVPEDLPVTSVEQTFLKKLRTVLDQHLTDENFGIEVLCEELAMSQRQVQRKIRATTGESPTDLIRSARLERARYLLEQQTGTVSEIAFEVGFNNLSYFSRCFRQRFGVTPSQFTKDK